MDFQHCFLQIDVYCRGDIDGVSVQGHRNRGRVGPNAWDEGLLSSF
jgi:hypothetical protein